jgi:NitT/TauT family transport system ATP-binding protein
MIKIQNVHKSFSGKVALREINLEIHNQEFLCLVGESGSGKTTLLKTIAGLDLPDRGEIFLDGDMRLHGVNFEASMVFQSAALLPWLSIKDNVIFPFKVTKTAFDSKEIERIILEVGLHNIENKYPRDLSGGQRQRVGIARALVVKRKILLLDEPFSALDIKTATELRRDLLELWKSKNLSVVMVSHLVEEAVELADRVVVMKNGEIISKLHIDLPRPRNTESHEFLKIVDHIKEIIEA